MSNETYALKFHPQQGWIKTKIIHATKVELPSDEELEQIQVELKKKRTKSYTKHRRNMWNNFSEKSKDLHLKVLTTYRGHA